MTDTTKLPVSTEQKGADVWRPFETLRREVDRLFDDFGAEFWRSPFRRSLFDIEPAFRKVMAVGAVPAVDVVEKDDAYEVMADVPGFDEKNIEIKLINGTLCIKGERKAEKEEKKEGRYLSEREFGSFERRFELPEGVDPDKIDARLNKGVLTVSLPKKPGAQKPVRKIEIKSAA